METDVERPMALQKEEKITRRSFLAGVLWFVPAVAVGATLWRLIRPPAPKLAPAEFWVTHLVIDPAEVEVGESVYVSVDVVNLGDLEGTLTVPLKVDGIVVDEKEVTLPGRETTFVTFTINADVEGTHEILVSGQAGTLNIVPPGPPVIDPELAEKFLRLLPEAAEFKAVVKDEKVIYYEAYDEAGLLIGYAFVTRAYAPTDKLEVIGIVDLDYNVVAVDVEPLPEYPELYNPEIRESGFEDQFVGLSVEELYLSPQGQVDGVTGASLSSLAVTEAVRKKIEEITQTS